MGNPTTLKKMLQKLILATLAISAFATLQPDHMDEPIALLEEDIANTRTSPEDVTQRIAVDDMTDVQTEGKTGQGFWHRHHRHHPHRHNPHRHHRHTPAPRAEVPCHGAYFQCFQERAQHGHRLQPVGAACSDMVRELRRRTRANLGCSHWYNTLTLAAGTAQLNQLRRDIPLNWVRPRGGTTIALENSFAACGSWGVGRGAPIDRLMTKVLPARCFTAAPTRFPTRVPTGSPTRPPTRFPTRVPTGSPPRPPTRAPPRVPTGAPTRVPTGSPTRPPTRAPTRVPTGTPVNARTRVLPGWCRDWRHQNTRQSQQIHGEATYFTGTSVTQESCIARCNASPRCHQAVFEQSGPWGPQCWLGNRRSSVRPSRSRGCSNPPAGRPRVPCVDFCYNKEGWEAVPAPPVPNCYFQFVNGCGGRCSQKRVWQCGHVIGSRANPLLAYDTWHRRLQHNAHETTCSTRGSPVLSLAEAAACVRARCPNGGSFRITANGQGMTGPSSSSACGSG